MSIRGVSILGSGVDAQGEGVCWGEVLLLPQAPRSSHTCQFAEFPLGSGRVGFVSCSNPGGPSPEPAWLRGQSLRDRQPGRGAEAPWHDFRPTHPIKRCFFSPARRRPGLIRIGMSQSVNGARPPGAPKLGQRLLDPSESTETPTSICISEPGSLQTHPQPPHSLPWDLASGH